MSSDCVGSSYLQRRAAWAEVGGCIRTPLCFFHKEPLLTIFGSFVKEQFEFRSFSNAWWIVTSADYLLPEVQPEQLQFNANAAVDIDADVKSSSGSSFLDGGPCLSQSDVSEEYRPFSFGLPPHAAGIAAKFALIDDDENALAEAPRAPRCSFIDDQAEVDFDSPLEGKSLEQMRIALIVLVMLRGQTESHHGLLQTSQKHYYRYQ